MSVSISGSMRRLGLSCVLVSSSGCSGDGDRRFTGGTDSGLSTTAGSGAETTAGLGETGSDGTADGDAGGSESSGKDGTDAGTDTGGSEDVCSRWNADRVDLSEGSWPGDTATCDAGDMDAAWRQRALGQINLYRWLADLPPVTLDPSRNAQAQACALMMHANGSLDHQPPAEWSCYTADGSSGAYNSNIAQAPAVASIDHYMIDWGNSTSMGHRRWILSNGLGVTGIGSTSGYSCMWALDGSGQGNAEWTAWPPPGDLPLAAVEPIFTSIDKGGWTVHSDTIDLTGATVTVTVEGTDMPVTVNELFPGPGSAWAIRFVPEGWSTTVDTTYHVEVGNIGSPIQYDVSVIDCG